MLFLSSPALASSYIYQYDENYESINCYLCLTPKIFKATEVQLYTFETSREIELDFYDDTGYFITKMVLLKNPRNIYKVELSDTKKLTIKIDENQNTIGLEYTKTKYFFKLEYYKNANRLFKLDN
jgi:hypothetical protein